MHLAVILVNLLFITKERNCMSEILLSDLKIGEQGIIHHFNDQNIALKLMEMGCLPGEEVTLERFAPMGDPIAIVVAGYSLSLRKSEASSVVLEQF
jgi:ferrous iron transport protein A